MVRQNDKNVLPIIKHFFEALFQSSIEKKFTLKRTFVYFEKRMQEYCICGQKRWPKFQLAKLGE